MNNIPKVKIGIVAVSRDCFPKSLSASRRSSVVKACKEKNIDIYEKFFKLMYLPKDGNESTNDRNVQQNTENQVKQ